MIEEEILSETGELPSSEAGELPSSEAGELPSSEAGELPSFEAGELPSFEAGELPSSETGELPSSSKSEIGGEGVPKLSNSDILESVSTDQRELLEVPRPFLTTPFEEYTVSEGFLLAIFLVLVVSALWKLIQEVF